MIIHCPQCQQPYEVRPEDLEPDGKRFRCGACRSVFFQAPPPKPPPAQPIALEVEDDDGYANPTQAFTAVGFGETQDKGHEKRRHKRESFYSRSLLRLTSGKKIQLDGITEDISSSGASMTLNNPLDLEEVKMGDKAVLEVILQEGRRPSFIEFPCEVVRKADEVLGLLFIDCDAFKQGSEPNKTFRPRSNSKVFVRRSDGSLDGGWEVLPPNASMPSTIHRIWTERLQHSLAVVCRKVVSGGVGYKIYSITDLKLIQEEAAELSLVPDS